MADVFFEVEENDVKYLDDLADEVTHYVSQIILEVYHGVARNIGVKDADALAARPPKRIQKGFLSGFKEISERIVSHFGKKRPVEPFTVRGGLKLYRKGKPMTQREWDQFSDQVTKYMKPYLSHVSEEMVVKAILLSMATAEAERQQKQIHEYGKKSLAQIQTEMYGGRMPETVAEARRQRKIDKGVARAMVNSYNHAAQYVQKVDDTVRDAIREQVVSALQKNKTPEELASDLYWKVQKNPDVKSSTAEQVLRDWRRVAVTEIAYAHAAGRMAEAEADAEADQKAGFKHPEKAVYFMFVRGTCPWCQAHHGKVGRMIPSDLAGDGASDKLADYGIKDPHTDTALWTGKNNVGFPKALWRLCVPAHPWNTAQLVRFNPAVQEYDEKTGRIRWKTDKELEKMIPKEVSGDVDDAEAAIKKRKDKMDADQKRGVYKPAIDYGLKESGKPAGAGSDKDGNPVVDVDGQRYVGVDAGDFNDYLERWRRNRSLPIPVSTAQREYQQFFGR